jgi:hypothetical protein
LLSRLSLLRALGVATQDAVGSLVHMHWPVVESTSKPTIVCVAMGNAAARSKLAQALAHSRLRDSGLTPGLDDESNALTRTCRHCPGPCGHGNDELSARRHSFPSALGTLPPGQDVCPHVPPSIVVAAAYVEYRFVWSHVEAEHSSLLASDATHAPGESSMEAAADTDTKIRVSGVVGNAAGVADRSVQMVFVPIGSASDDS